MTKKNYFKESAIVFAVIAVSLGLFSKALNARNSSKSENIKKQMREVFTKEYTGEDLLNILANIESDIRKEDNESLHKRAKEVSDYLDYRKTEIVKHEKKYANDESFYSGSRVLEIEHGKRFNAKKTILPLTIQNNPLTATLEKNDMSISSFGDNEINEVTVRYVSYDSGNNEAGINLRRLLSNVEKGNVTMIRENIGNIYENILVDHDNKISLVAKIRDNLAVAKFLLANNQAKAAQKSIGATDSLMLRLIEARADSPSEQQRIRNLRKDLENVSKVSDASYLSEWEKMPQEIEGWWNKKEGSEARRNTQKN